MAFEVTATRRRPQTFADMAGQDFFVSTISNAIKQNRIAHAYLFSGPRGVGKTSSARILAKALNCEHGPTDSPCGVCSNCREITAGNSTDVIEIDGASNTSVNDIRTIKDEVMFPPQKSRYKIYIIDEVHMLSTSAFNALLKTIEEPPEYIIFIFATTETQKVPATIRSRCQQFRFQLFSMETVVRLLDDTAKEMGIQADQDALFWIAKESTGSMRDAYTLFDQVVSFSDGHLNLATIQEKLGVSGIESLNDIVLSLQEKDRSRTEALLSALLFSGISIEQCIKDFATYFRTILLLKHGVTSVDALGVRTDAIPQDLVDAYTDEQAEAALELFLQTYRDIRYSVNPRFELELAVSRLAQLRYAASARTVMKHLYAMKKELLGMTDTASLQNAAPQQELPQESSPMAQPQPARPSRFSLDLGAKTTRTPQATISSLPPEAVESPSLPARQEPPAQTASEGAGPAVKASPAPPPVQEYDEEPREEPAPQPPAKPPVARPFTKEDIPVLVDLFNRLKHPARFNLTYLIDVISRTDMVTLVFKTRFSADSLQKVLPFLRERIRDICGYSGPVEISLQKAGEPALQESKDETDSGNGDPLEQKIAKMFNSRKIIHQNEQPRTEKDTAQ